MKHYLKENIIRNFKRIPYFFNQNFYLHFEQNNYALLGKLSASLLHDVLTPLTSLSISSEILKDSDIKNLAPLIKESGKQIHEYVDIMKEFLSETNTNSTLHVNTVIKKCLLLLKHKALSNNIQIQFLEFDQIQSKVSSIHIYQIIINLLSNAIEASVESSTKKIILIIKKDREHYVIDCKDFGAGMDTSSIQKIGKNIFSSKSKKRGFGLYSINHIVQNILKGTLHVQSELTIGSLFTCVLPIRK